ncbi:MAG: hypothetical protein PHR81_09870 [Bacteroidales bacterium]|nr:hypothetical protein [Bacteroidales bacterium]
MYLIKYTFFLVIFILYSCKKNNDTISPQITITIPYENQSFHVFDDIHVMAAICDDRTLEYVSVTVTDVNFVTVLSGGAFYPDNSCYSLNTYIEIDDIMLPSGVYYLLLKAYDGTNETKRFLKIYIHEAEKELQYVLVVTKNNQNIRVHKIDSANHVSQMAAFISDYTNSCISSDAQQFYIAGKFFGDVNVYEMNEWQLNWNVPCINNPPFPYFVTIETYKDLLYVSFYEGKFQIYNRYGSIIASRVTDDVEYPVTFFPDGDFLLTYERSYTGMEKHFVMYYVPSFVVYKRILLSYEIKKIFRADTDYYLLFTNNSGQGKIRLVSPSTETFWDIYTHNEGIFTDVAITEPGQYIFCDGNNVYTYDYSSGICDQWVAAPNSTCMAYDGTQGFAYFSRDYFNVIKKNLQSTILQTSFMFSDTVYKILPVFNKD